MIYGIIPYFIILGIIMFFYYNNTIYNKDNQKLNVWIILTFLSMTLFAGLRDLSVGTDTRAYVNGFLSEESISNNISLKEFMLSEPGYYLLKYITRNITINYWLLLVFIAGICYFIILYSIDKYSKNGLISLFIYITLGYYTFCFNAARQAIAVSIFVLSIPCILNNNFIKYSLIVCIAALFHKSVLIAIPLFYLFRLPYSWRSITILGIISIIITIELPTILSSASEIENRYSVYAENKATGGYLLTLFYILLSVFFCYLRNRISKDSLKNYDILLQMLICGSLIYFIVSITGSYVELQRFAAYFQIASIFLFAEIINKHKTVINPVLFSAICIGCLIFYYIFVSTMAKLTPYKFNQIIFS